MTITDDELKAFVERLNICPTCSAAWDYSRPAAITHGDGTPTGQVRCVHCKAVYDDPDTVKAIVSELLALRQSSPPDGQTAGDGLDKDEQMAIAEHLMMLADLDTEDAEHPPCTDFCGNRVCDQLGCVVWKYQRTHSIPTPSSETKAPEEEH